MVSVQQYCYSENTITFLQRCHVDKVAYPLTFMVNNLCVSMLLRLTVAAKDLP